MAKFLGQTGLVYLWGKIKNYVSNYVKITSSTGKDTITAGNNSIDVYDWAQASTKPSYNASEVGALPSSTTIPSKTSDLTNDSGFITTSDIPDGVSPYTSTPEMNGVGNAGSSALYAKGDHVHPSDTSKVNTSAVGAANGVCPLDSNTKIDAQYLPSYVDDIIEAYIRTGQTALSSTWLATGSASGTTITPESGKIYVLMNSDSTYSENTEFRWGGSTYVKLNDGGISEMTTSEMDTATDNWA